VVHSCELADLFTRTVTIGKNFKTFSELWEKSGVRGIASQFSDVVLASVPQRQAEETGKFFSSNRQNMAAQLTYWIWYPAKRTNKTSMPDQRTLKRRRTCLDNGIMTPPSILSTSVATHATSNETQCCPSEQSQHSASRDPSLKHILLHTKPPHSFHYKVSSNGCNGTNTSGTTTNGTFHQSFSHLGLASCSQNKPRQATPGPTPSQCLQYEKSVDESTSEDRDNGLSKSSSSASLRTSISIQGCHQGQGHIYRADIEAGDLIGTGGRDQSNGEQSISILSNP